MTAAAAPQPFQLGDRVLLRRDLSHPAWGQRTAIIAGEERIFGPETQALIGESTISEIGASFPTRRPIVRVAGNHLWYDAATGIQENSGATTITKIDPEQESK